MSNRARPRVHARDHEHGGADPHQIVYEDVGDEGGGTTGHVIADEGTPLPSRGTLDFVGDGVTATDDSGSDSTIVTIPGGGGADGGIHFDTDPQAGGYLVITTTAVNGDITITSAPADGEGLGGGDIILSMGQWLILAGIPSNIDPGVTGAIWADHGVLRISGYS